MRAAGVQLPASGGATGGGWAHCTEVPSATQVPVPQSVTSWPGWPQESNWWTSPLRHPWRALALHRQAADVPLTVQVEPVTQSCTKLLEAPRESHKRTVPSAQNWAPGAHTRREQVPSRQTLPVPQRLSARQLAGGGAATQLPPVGPSSHTCVKPHVITSVPRTPQLLKLKTLEPEQPVRAFGVQVHTPEEQTWPLTQSACTSHAVPRTSQRCTWAPLQRVAPGVQMRGVQVPREQNSPRRQSWSRAQAVLRAQTGPVGPSMHSSGAVQKRTSEPRTPQLSKL